jgi:ATP-binding cassette subfamily B protein
MGTVGGIPRSYGLQRHFTKPEYEGPPPKINRSELARIAGYFTPYWEKWLVILLCIAVTSGLSVVPPFCVAMILDRGIPDGDIALIAVLASVMVALAVSTGFIGVIQQSLTAKAGQNIVFNLRNQLFRHLQGLSLHFYASTRSGEIVSRINNDVGAVQGVATGTIVAIASNIATLAATSIALFSMNWRLAIVAVLVVPAFYLPSRVVGRIRRRLSAETQASQASLLGFLQERLHVGGALLTKIFGQGEADAEVFAAENMRLRDLNIRQAVVGRWLFMILSVFSAMGPALIYLYGGYQVIQAELTPGLLVAFAALLTLLYRPLIQLATVYGDIQASFAVFQRIFDCLDLTPDVRDKPQPMRVEHATGEAAFEGVCFAYPPRVGMDSPSDGSEEDRTGEEPFALRDVSFQIASGERVALVGPSGGGKTTITYLLPRFFDPDEGRILLDGHDLRDLDQLELRRRIGIVTQETFLFHDTIRANLLYARPNADDSQLADACRVANIHDFIVSLPDRYDTIVGEKGFRLSGGEKQRISIARALLKDPAILILDEATSNLDATSEFLIQGALEKLLEGRTSLIVAHRLSTILGSDRIEVMDGGRIVESGSHEELLTKSGLYSVLFKRQFGQILNR